MTLTLTPLTRNATNHIANHGPLWRLLDTRQTVLFTDTPGPWLMVESIKDIDAGKGLRSFVMWVKADGDAEYRVELSKGGVE